MKFIFFSFFLAISFAKTQEHLIICDISLSSVFCSENICECNNNNTYEGVDQLIIKGTARKKYYDNHTILINNSSLEVKFTNVTIEYSHCHVSPFLAYNSDIDFKFEGENNIYQWTSHEAGLECANESSIKFTYSRSFEDDYLYVEGNMKGAGIGTGEYSGHCKQLTFNDGNITGLTYGEASGIGTGNNHPSQKVSIGQITINGGNITARGPRGTYYYGSGLGVGMNGTVESIIINGGNLTARGNHGSGIGGGFGGHIGEVVINNGNINSYSYGCSAIGGGYSYDVMEKILINNGTINATSYFGAAIGGGSQAEVKDIIINDGLIYARVEGDAFSYSAGIGSGQNATCHNIKINGGHIKTYGFYGAGIGASNGANCSIINITGGTIYAKGTKGAGIGAGAGYNSYKGGVDLISISGGNITSIGVDSAGIGGGYSFGLHCSNVGSIEISGDSTVIKSTGINGAGIGGCYTHKRFGSHINSIKISGGTITSNGTCGIGGSSRDKLDTGSVDSIEITGGQIIAEGLYNGIGAGKATRLKSLVISGGNITAKSTVKGSGIGGGGSSQIGAIVIQGGTVNAVAEGHGGCGIGVGSSSLSQADSEANATIEKILISKAKITARGKNQGAGIGGGETVMSNSTFIGEIVIESGSQIDAYGGDFGAGIGGGYEAFVGKLNIHLSESDDSRVVGIAGDFAEEGIGNGYFGKVAEIDNLNGHLVCTSDKMACVFSQKEDAELPQIPTRVPSQSATSSEIIPTQSDRPSDIVPTNTNEPSESDQFPSQSTPKPKKILTPAVIAGIAVGSAAVVAGLAVGMFFLFRKKKLSPDEQHNEDLLSEDGAPRE